MRLLTAKPHNSQNGSSPPVSPGWPFRLRPQNPRPYAQGTLTVGILPNHSTHEIPEGCVVPIEWANSDQGRLGRSGRRGRNHACEIYVKQHPKSVFNSNYRFNVEAVCPQSRGPQLDMDRRLGLQQFRDCDKGSVFHAGLRLGPVPRSSEIRAHLAVAQR